jgi:hypothetical protein
MTVEFVHGSHDPLTDVTQDDPIVTGKERMESEAERYWSTWAS